MKKLYIHLLVVSAMFFNMAGQVFAQDGATPKNLDGKQAITVATEKTEMIFTPDGDNRLQLIFYGTKGSFNGKYDSLAEAYFSGGSDFYYSPALRVTHEDGNTSTLLKLQKSEQKNLDGNIVETRIYLKDDYYNFYVTLVFKAYQKENLIAQHVVFENKEKKAVTIYNFASTALTFSPGKYYLTQFHGKWADEMNMVEELLTPGIKVLDSKLGVRAHEMRNPTFLLGIGEPAREDNGNVIGGSLAWSGSFEFSFEFDENGRLFALCGMNPYMEQRILEPGKTFVTPEMLLVYSNKGTGEMSRSFQDWGRKYGVREGYTPRSILLNNWEATFFDFDEKKLVSLFEGAKKLGFELFLLDDGWFGNKYPRNDDHAGLGDWDVNKKKLPNGVEALCVAAEKIGIDFGIWVEPEMVNPKSELYEKHPDWVIGQKHRPLNFRRNQLNLDLSNPDVREFCFNVVDHLLTANPDIRFVKWDANRFVTNGGSYYLKPELQSHLIYDYHVALYDIMDRVMKKHPNVRMMLCSGGGGRVDYKALSYFHEFWPSDNTDPVQRVYIQWGYSMFYPSIAVAGHVTHWGARPIKFAFDVAMSVRMGMDRDLAKLNEQELAFSKNAIAEYKRVRDVVQLGTQYRLISPYGSNRSASMYVNEDKSHAIAFVFQIKNAAEGDSTTVALKGLIPGKQYKVREINRMPDASGKTSAEVGVFSGKQLMDGALDCRLNAEITSSVYEITAVAN